MNTSISASDIAHGILIKHLIISCRKGECLPFSAMTVMSYFSDVVTCPSAKQFVSYADLSSYFNDTFHDSDNRDSMLVFINQVKDILDKVVDVLDSFFTAVESIREVLILEKNASMNELSGPTYITPDSFLGMYVRSLLAQWECMTFEDMCSLYQQMKTFLRVSSTRSLRAQSKYSDADATNLLVYSVGTNDYLAHHDADNVIGVRRGGRDDSAQTCELRAHAALEFGDIGAVEASLHELYDITGCDPLSSVPNASSVGLSPAAAAVDRDGNPVSAAADSAAATAGGAVAALGGTGSTSNRADIDRALSALTRIGTSSRVSFAAVAGASSSISSSSGSGSGSGSGAGGVNAARNSTSASGGASSTNGVPTTGSAASANGGREMPSSSQQQQQAMLSIARMWLLGAGNTLMALSAVEEALKTAHYRGDHATVAQALLFMHSLFRNSLDPELQYAAEAVLLRCTRRCAALGLQSLTAQSALLLIVMRAQQPLLVLGGGVAVAVAPVVAPATEVIHSSLLQSQPQSQPQSQLSSSSSSSSSSSMVNLGTAAQQACVVESAVNSTTALLGAFTTAQTECLIGGNDAHFTIGELWTHLSCTLLGDTALIPQVVSARGVGAHANNTGGAAAGGGAAGPASTAVGSGLAQQHLLQHQLQQQAGAAGTGSGTGKHYGSGNETLFAVNPAFVQLTLQSALLTADLWFRTGLFHMADLSLRRSLKLYAAYATVSDLVSVYMKLLLIKADTTYFLFLGNRSEVLSSTSSQCEQQGIDESKQNDNSYNSNPYDELVALWHSVKTQFRFLDSQSHALAQCMESTKLYLVARQQQHRALLQPSIRVADSNAPTDHHHQQHHQQQQQQRQQRQQQWARAYRCATRLVAYCDAATSPSAAATGNIKSPSSTSSANSIYNAGASAAAVRNSSNRNNNNINNNNNNNIQQQQQQAPVLGITESAARARFLLAEVTSGLDRPRGQQQFAELVERCAASGLTTWYCLSLAARARHALQQSDATTTTTTNITTTAATTSAPPPTTTTIGINTSNGTAPHHIRSRRQEVSCPDPLPYAVLQQALNLARKYNVGLVEAYIVPTVQLMHVQ